jgi:signal transduction histidine kinase
VDPDGVLWVATDGGGLARLRDGRWTRYTTREGLVSNSLGYLLDDDAGYLWIGSNAGLMRVARQALNDFAEGRITSVPCRAYGKPDGLPTRECTSGSQPGAVRARDGTLWFPTIKGLTSVDPTQLHPNTNPPPVLIESVLVDDQPFSRLALGVKGPESVTIPAGRERLEIHYTSLNLGAPDRARFRYRLEDYESAWVEAGNTRVVRYPKLPPDDYRFRVIACNEDGVWNETGSSLAITVLPPFWQTGWFLTASALALLGTIVGSVHYVSTQRLKRQVERMKQREALEKERGRIARDLHDQLGASLTQIALLGELAESDKDAAAEVEAHAQQISKTARETTRVLDEIVWAVNPSNDTLEGLINYVCKYAQDYLTVAGLRCRLEVPAQLPATALPPEVRHNVFLAAKEALTNVVRHAQATEARLRLRLEPTAFTLEIEDNGRGVAGLNDPRAQTRNGLRNMRRRMEDLGGSFSIGPSPGRGAVVRLTVPLDNRRTSLN